MALKPYKGTKRSELKSGLIFPLGLSFKVDGFRCMGYEDKANSSSGKQFPNLYVNEVFQETEGMLNGLDGELCVGNPWDKNLMQQCTSGLNSEDGMPDFTWWIFDDFSDIELPFLTRYRNYIYRVEQENNILAEMGLPSFLRAVEYRDIQNIDQYNAMKEEAAAGGYEGLYGKSWKGQYKHGRATPKDGSCWKDKPWTDEEGEIIGFVEMMENQNESFKDELGRTKRATNQENLVGKGILGSYIVSNKKYKKTFRVSCGSMTMERREKLWKERDSELGKIITYKFFDFGIVDVPRSALYKNHRPLIDMTDY